MRKLVYQVVDSGSHAKEFGIILTGIMGVKRVSIQSNATLQHQHSNHHETRGEKLTTTDGSHTPAVGMSMDRRRERNLKYEQQVSSRRCSTSLCIFKAGFETTKIHEPVSVI